MKLYIFSLINILLILGCGSGLCPMGRGQLGVCRVNGSGLPEIVGALDTSFNITGVATFNLGASDFAYSVDIQSDGKIVVGGTIGNADNDFGVLRLHSDGSIDTTFNTVGYVSTNLTAFGDAISSIKIQSDGKIVAMGNAPNDFAVVRYHSNGSLDTTFNTTGFVTTSVTGFDNCRSGALQPDGKILAVGQFNNATVDAGIIRYHSNGSLDTTFNTTGYTSLDIAGGSDVARAVAIQPDGKIVIAGQAQQATVNFFVARYHSNGSIDTTFNTTGFVTTDIGTTDIGRSLAIQSDGKILLGGYATIAGNSQFAIARYHSNGSLDTTFNTTGYVTTAFSTSDEIYSITLQSNGKIIATGSVWAGANSAFAIARYHSNGSLDTTFAVGGSLTTNVVAGGNDESYSVAKQSDGRMVSVGYGSNATNDFVIIRYR